MNSQMTDLSLQDEGIQSQPIKLLRRLNTDEEDLNPSPSPHMSPGIARDYQLRMDNKPHRKMTLENHSDNNEVDPVLTARSNTKLLGDQNPNNSSLR